MTRAALLYATAGALLVGVPATFAPEVFFDDFPFLASWVDELPPYNEHLVTDVGGLYLGFALLLGWAIVRPALVVPVCTAFALVQVLHTAFHVSHLEGFSTVDGIAQTALLLALVVAPIVAIAGARRRRPTRAMTGSDAP